MYERELEKEKQRKIFLNSVQLEILSSNTEKNILGCNVCVCVCVCMYVCMYVCVCMYICMYVCVCVSMCVCMCVCRGETGR